ncbi:MAG TPA: ABC transporter substrate-binding protein [Ktedonobacteraceae bacterium]|jgi:peptide/nickel transport system substrate-binding protein
MIDHPAIFPIKRLWRGTKATSKLFLLLLLSLVVVLAACGGGGNTNTPRASTLRVLSAPGQGNPDLFNPYFITNAGSDFGSQGLLYETLYFQNLYNSQLSPWLASSYQYSSDLTQLTFHMRPGVKWNDGQTLTSQDVVFTFNLMKQHPALDQNSVWPTLLQGVSAPDDNTVVFTLQHPDNTALFKIGDQVFIVPQHVWQNISGDPAKFANDKNPVGTGPYLLQSYSSQLITYKKNPSYWGTKPQVDTIQVPSITDNTTAILDMTQGTLDWMGTGWDPSYDASYVNKDPQHNLHWFAPSNTVMLYMNLQKYPFNLLPVRQAISAAINREALPQGAAQYAKVASPSGVVVPSLSSWVAPQYQNSSWSYSPSQAASYLQQAGFTKRSNGYYYDKNGKEFSMTLTVVNGWSDWQSDTANIQHNLQAVGINATINTVGGYTPYYNAISTGNYDAAISWTNGGPTPYYPFQALLNSANSAKPGAAVAGTNFERWSNSATDQLLKEYVEAKDVNGQKQAIYGLEDILVSQLPVIPLTVNVYWDEYTTRHFTGWPDANNPYDVAAPYQAPDCEYVILHLKPAS